MAAFGEFTGVDFHVVGAVEVGQVGIAVFSGGGNAEGLAVLFIVINDSVSACIGNAAERESHGDEFLLKGPFRV